MRARCYTLCYVNLPPPFRHRAMAHSGRMDTKRAPGDFKFRARMCKYAALWVYACDCTSEGFMVAAVGRSFSKFIAIFFLQERERERAAVGAFLRCENMVSCAGI